MNSQLIVMLMMIYVIASTLSQYVEFQNTHRRNGGEPRNIDYSFRYFIDEPNGVSLDHWESKNVDGTVVGGYGVKDPNGNIRTVHYEVEDDSGFKAVIRNVWPGAVHFQQLSLPNGQPRTPIRHAEPVNTL